MTAVAPPAAGPEPLAHKRGISHPRPIQGCCWCVQPDLCWWCGKPRDARPGERDACPDWDGHGALHYGSETTWRAAA